MIVESIAESIVGSVVVAALALGIDFIFGDPRNRYHPTAWIGIMIARLVPLFRYQSTYAERIGGTILILLVATATTASLYAVEIGIGIISVTVAIRMAVESLPVSDAAESVSAYLTYAILAVTGAILLKLTIAARGMERHAMSVIKSLEQGDIDSARAGLSRIVKRNTADLDEDHVISGVLESVSENTVDGVTGPLFYYSIFGVLGAFMYRVVNTADSMIGYRTDIFKNVGWFAASCDTVLNYIPARITGLIMVVSAAILQNDWRGSYRIMTRDATKTSSHNAGYPMAALAGALGIRLEKLGHYSLGDPLTSPTRRHVHSAIAMMRLCSVLFFAMVVVPMLSVMYVVWWFHV